MPKTGIVPMGTSIRTVESRRDRVASGTPPGRPRGVQQEREAVARAAARHPHRPLPLLDARSEACHSRGEVPGTVQRAAALCRT